MSSRGCFQPLLGSIMFGLTTGWTQPLTPVPAHAIPQTEMNDWYAIYSIAILRHEEARHPDFYAVSDETTHSNTDIGTALKNAIEAFQPHDESEQGLISDYVERNQQIFRIEKHLVLGARYRLFGRRDTKELF
ncbi:MAG TPA: hypothetical protein VMU17_04810, partial [Elusimicrobiota bacterium]|nr:hypothetical protein [Elusimicrobiota bacterium]